MIALLLTCFSVLLPARADAPLDIDPWTLVRVDQPDVPGAIASSDQGSLLLSPPTGMHWRYEPIAEADEFDAWEAKEAMNIAPWHAAGFDGTGVKVAVFDYLYQEEDLEDELGEFHTQDCVNFHSCDPPFDPLRPNYVWEEGAHGAACAEVIHDVAPGAELYLVRVNGLTSIENGVAWAVRNHIDLISMSLSFYGDSFYDGTGGITTAMDALEAGGVLMVKSAGNSATEHWQEAFTDTDGDGMHEFGGGSTYLPVYLSAGPHAVYLNWDQYGDCGKTDLNAWIRDRDGNLIGRGMNSQVSDSEQTCQPLERFTATAAEEGWHWVQIQRAAGSPSTEFSLFVRGGDIYNAMAEGSMVDPASHPAVLAVGAVRATSDYLTNAPESFSSQGPTNNGLNKPEIAGPDGLSCSVFGAKGFYGTSASTPAVVGALAVLMSGDPTLDPYQAADQLRATAVGDGAVWAEPDRGLGDGRARLPPPDNAESEGGGCASHSGLLPCLIGWLLVRARRLEAGCGSRS